MSRTFSTNSGSVESLNVSWRCGCKRERASRCAETAVCASPVALGHGACAPVRRPAQHALQRPGNHGIDTGIVNRSWRARARRVQQAIQAMFDEPCSPLADHLRRNPLARGRHLVVVPIGAGQHDARALRQACAVLRRNVRALSSSRSMSVKTSDALGLPLIAASSSTHGTRETTALKNSSMNFQLTTLGMVCRTRFAIAAE
jgi:hypothetical protein